MGFVALFLSIFVSAASTEPLAVGDIVVSCSFSFDDFIVAKASIDF